jgi:hypothetical protein
MDIILSSDNIDVQACDVVATGFFLDERPLRGASGWIDWRLNGRLSRLIQAKRLTGEWKETILIPSEGRIVAPLILLIGLGRVKEYAPFRLRELSAHLIMTLQGIQAPTICLSFPCEEPYDMDCGKTAEVLVEAIADCLNSDPRLMDEEWVKNLRLLFPQDTDRFEETLLGIESAKSILGDRFQINVSLASDRPGSPEKATGGNIETDLSGN